MEDGARLDEAKSLQNVPGLELGTLAADEAPRKQPLMHSMPGNGRVSPTS